MGKIEGRMNCWAESYCRGYPMKCGSDCVGWIQLSTVYHLSHMPVRYQRGVTLTLLADDQSQRDRDSYLYLKNWMLDVVKNVEDGRGLYIVSRHKGNGKTAWACKIMNEYFRHVALHNNMRCRGLFVNVPSFLQELRDSMDSPSDDVDAKVDAIMRADMVIWDDIGTENPTSWVRERLYGYINHRYSNSLTQIFTSNVMLEELAHERFMGERIASRIAGQCDIIEFHQRDRRID